MLYKENNVFDEALERINMLFDTHDDIIVNMSGGKDSTVLFNLALSVAKERNRLPLKVFWLDQEAEWQRTVDYMNSIMRMPEVQPLWYQIPFDFTNSLSAKNNFLRVWDETQADKWIHPKSDISIKENPTKLNRFHDLMTNLPDYCTESDNCAVLVGMRMQESQHRRLAICFGRAKFQGITWCQVKKGKKQVFWPIYDFTMDDIWTAIAKNHWKYNPVYDLMYRWGLGKRNMRVSSLIHETAWQNLAMLQEFEPETYNRFTTRIPGISCANHSFDEGGYVPKTLPFAFKDWKEYRDYLLVHITKPEYWDLFRNRWKGQDGEEWYKVHAREVIINDIDGTSNMNQATHNRVIEKAKKGFYYNKDMDAFLKWKESKEEI